MLKQFDQSLLLSIHFEKANAGRQETISMLSKYKNRLNVCNQYHISDKLWAFFYLKY